MLRQIAFISSFAFALGCSSITVKDQDLKADDGFTVSVTEYSRDKEPNADTVIILPPTGGSTVIESNYARRLSQRGQHVFIVQGWTGLDNQSVEFDIHNQLFSYAHRAIGMVIDKSSGKVKLLGTSLGGLYGLSAISRYPQIRRAVLIVAGYPFTEVIARSNYASMADLREAREAKFGPMTPEAYQEKLNAVFKWNDDENIRSPQLDRTKILLIQGLADDVVPTDSQKNLAQRLTSAKVLKFNHGHVSTIVRSFLFDADVVLDHLTEKENLQTRP